MARHGIDNYGMEKYRSAAALLCCRQPENPVIGLRPHVAARSAEWFVHHFPGTVLYAVKANNSPLILGALYDGGVRDFDVASMAEIEQVSHYTGATIYLMHPVKSRRTIGAAYHDYGVRDFALDSFEELDKILAETNGAKDLNLYVRICCSGDGAVLPLEQKFGVSLADAADLLLASRRVGNRLGITFHIGSQAMEPDRYRAALMDVDQLIIRSGVLPDVIDVGGGFPVPYAGLTPPALDVYVSTIARAFEQMCVVETCALQCQPGRALVASAGSIIVRVDARRKNALYINDGAYGSLFDAAHFDFSYPARLVSNRLYDRDRFDAYSLFGPTCDSFDAMKGPFMLPADVGEGDYIEIGQIGAYGSVMATGFNGYGVYDHALLIDAPLLETNFSAGLGENIIPLHEGYEAKGQ